MYFLKHAFQQPSKVRDEDDYLTTLKKSNGVYSPHSAFTTKQSITDEQSEQSRHSTGKRGARSLLKIRRFSSNRNEAKENLSPDRKKKGGHSSNLHMSSDIHSLIQDFHENTSDWREDMVNKTNSKHKVSGTSIAKAAEIRRQTDI